MRYTGVLSGLILGFVPKLLDNVHFKNRLNSLLDRGGSMKKEDKEKLLEKISYTLNFNRHGPFFNMVASFFVACVGLNPTLEELMPKDKAFIKMKQNHPKLFQPSIS